MGCSSSSSVKKTVVVIGGGPAGTAAARLLDPYCNVIAIEKRGVYIHKIGSVRAIVNTEFSNLIGLDKYLIKGKQTTGVVVTELHKSHVVLSDGTKINYDVAVIAVGGRSYGPMEPAADAVESSLQDVQKWFAKVASAIKASNSIVIVGGGPVGVETSGEIRDMYPDKKITILHSADKLCNTATPELSDKLAAQCKANKIDVKYNVKANLKGIIDIEKDSFFEGKTDVPLSDGTVVTCDLILPCVGFSPNGKSISNVPLDDKGFIKVNKYLQVEGYDNVFAIGDCNNCGDPKMALFAGSKFGMGMPVGQADIAVKNIKALSEGKPLTARVIIPHGTFIVPLGSKGGATQGIPGMFAGKVLKMKGADYFIGTTAKALKNTAALVESSGKTAV